MGADLATSKLFPLHFLCFITLLLFHPGFGFADKPQLHPQEVKALKNIAKKLGKRDWDFGRDPCSGEGTWAKNDDRKGFETHITCDCSFSRTSFCRIVSIALKSQNLSGSVPAEFSKLRYLKVLDLSRNLLRGSLPKEWVSMRVENVSFMGNRLSGPFPRVLTSITSLRNLSLEGNNFTGPIPKEIGNLVHLEKLHLSSNAFTGKLPAELTKLKNLTDLRISDNDFTGRIPDFIGNWCRLRKLHIQGCGLEGPIPSSISSLTKLHDLRISDLKGQASSFPALSRMGSLKTMVLRNCLIYGQIPEYIGHMNRLKILDLSFNKLTGGIPTSFDRMGKADFIYLTGNKLTGPVPMYILERNKNLDVSFNNFTLEGSTQNQCPRGSVNLVEGFSLPRDRSSKPNPCLIRNFPCSSPSRQHHYSLFINCGGGQATLGNNKYDADFEPRGASMFYISPDQRWAFSSTGDFMDNNIDGDEYLVKNTSSLFNVSSTLSMLYTSARGSPNSLTYYGLCLINGNYTVKLHFAEIVFMNDSSFYSLGKRVFDVYIQDKLVIKDFNIKEAAGGAGKPVVKPFTAPVTDHTLKIRLSWAGKGTTGIPKRGDYGPLISAISVEPNFKPPVYKNTERMILQAGIAAASALLALLLVIGVLWWKGWLRGKKPIDEELRGLEQQTGLFTLKQIKTATDNFDTAKKVGEGGFGSVYRGVLPDGTVIAVKQLSSKSRQGNREFVTEIGMISAQQHPNLVKLYGCCVEGNQLLLIYEYMENNCLSRALFGKDEACRLKLDWPTRKKICVGIARGLAYLHEESRIKIVHRDIKTSNVLLDKDLNAKISDFGLARLSDDGNTHISTRIAGTIGYMAPEYAMRGYLTDKADVYSFGVVALEIISGKSNTSYRPDEDYVYLLDWAYVLQEKGNLLELVDPNLGLDFPFDEAMLILNVALLCTNASPSLRPKMSQVVSMLEGRTGVQDLLSDPSCSAINPKLKQIRSHFWENPSRSRSFSTSDRCTDLLNSDGEEEETQWQASKDRQNEV